MINSKLYVLIGPPGCGKSTWAKEFNEKYPEVYVVSRDAIRFAMLQEDDDYFEHEEEVLKKYYVEIQKKLEGENIVVADATHLSPKQRRKLLNGIHFNKTLTELIYVIFNTGLETCMERNACRSGRAKVPDGILKNMWSAMTLPTEQELELVSLVQKINEPEEEANG